MAPGSAQGVARDGVSRLSARWPRGLRSAQGAELEGRYVLWDYVRERKYKREFSERGREGGTPARTGRSPD